MQFSSLFCVTAAVCLIGLSEIVIGGDHGLVDDEIWHHVTKVLSEHEGHGKVLLSHPEPAHLVDAYTKVYHHEPHYDNYHAHHDNHHHEHGHHPHHAHYSHAHYSHPPPPPPPHYHHHHHAPALFRVPVPVLRYGPPPPHHHHYLH